MGRPGGYCYVLGSLMSYRLVTLAGLIFNSFLSQLNMALLSLDQHVAELCVEHNVRRIVKPGRGRCRAHARVIRHPPIQEEMNYFVALHEIGHAVLGLPAGLSRLDREAWCWQWALANAAYEPHFSTRQRISACLVRYLYRAIDRGWKIPTAGSDFWVLLAWWDYAAA